MSAWVEIVRRRAQPVDRLDEHVAHSGLLPGVSVEVRDRFCAGWARGFAIAETTQRGYLVRRVSDGYVLPVEFAPRDVRHPTSTPMIV